LILPFQYYISGKKLPLAGYHINIKYLSCRITIKRMSHNWTRQANKSNAKVKCNNFSWKHNDVTAITFEPLAKSSYIHFDDHQWYSGTQISKGNKSTGQNQSTFRRCILVNNNIKMIIKLQSALVSRSHT